MPNTKRSAPFLPKPIALNDLQPGDILMFRSPEKRSALEKFMSFMQALVGQKHGHYDTTHSAICIQNKNKEPVIAHVNPDGGIGTSTAYYTQEPLRNFFKHHGERAFFIFRPKDPKSALEIAKVAKKNQNYHVKWSLMSLLQSFTQKALPPQGIKEPGPLQVSLRTTASQFVTECIKLGLKATHHYFGLRANSSNKALESHLYKNQKTYGFELGCYLGEKPFHKIHIEILKQIQALQQDALGSFENQKNLEIMKAYTQAIARLEEATIYNADGSRRKPNEMENCLYLLNAMLPEFNKTDGLWFINTSSYRAISSLARNMGLMEHDLEAFAASDLKAAIDNDKQGNFNKHANKA